VNPCNSSDTAPAPHPFAKQCGMCRGRFTAAGMSFCPSCRDALVAAVAGADLSTMTQAEAASVIALARAARGLTPTTPQQEDQA